MMALAADFASSQTTSPFDKSSGGSGQAYPNKPVRIVTAEAGGGADFVARLLAQGLTGGLGQQFIVDNRGGAGGQIAMETVAKAPADGYVLLFFSNGMWTLPLLQKVGYDPVKDFAPVSLVDRIPNLLVVHPSLPVKNVRELIALAKARPGELNYGAGSNGSSPHIAAELFRSMTGISAVKIPYKGTGPALIGLLSGQVHFMFPNAAAVTPYLKSGRLRALAVANAAPSALLPHLPTIAASGVPGYAADASHSLFAPAATPKPIVSRLNEEVVRALQRADLKERLLSQGVEPAGTTPEQLAATIAAEMPKMAKLIKDAGIRPD